MNFRRNLVRGAVAFAFLVPAGLVAGLEGPSLLAWGASPAYPVACSLHGTVAFSPPLTKLGVVGPNAAAVTTTTITGGTLTNCLSSDQSGSPTGGTFPTLTIATPATKLIGVKVNKVQQYATGYCPAFAGTTTLKSLKGLAITVTWTGGAGGTSSFVDNTPGIAFSFAYNEAGFTFLGKQGAGSYSQKALNQITVYLDPTASGALSTACAANQTVSGATIDPVSSTAIL